MPWLEAFGWLGALLTIGAHSMRNMQGLRTVALGSNVLFISYGFFAQVYPMLVLNAVLLPLNLYRLFEIFTTRRRLRAARKGTQPLDALEPFLTPSHHADGHVLFHRGDTADSVYYLVDGCVDLPEIGETIAAPALLGEMAFFTRKQQRTTSAICRGACRIMSIDDDTFTRVYYTQPEFGLYVIRLMARRLIEGGQKRPDLYRDFAP